MNDELPITRDIYPMPAFLTLIVSDLEPGLPALAERLAAHAPGSSAGLQRMPWNVDELRCTDPDGYAIVFTERVPEDEIDQVFSAAVLASIVPDPQAS